MSDTPRTDEMERILYETRPCDWIVEQTRIKHARDLERELTETAKDFRCLAELLDGHDATECRLNLVKLKSELAAERALADRMALSLDIALGDWSELYATHETPAYDEAQVAIAAWKEARREAQ